MSLTLTTGDTAPSLAGVCRDGTAPANLAGATLAVHVRRQDNTIINRAGTIVSGPDGTWSLDLTDGDLNVAGTYAVEVQVTYSSGKVQTFGPVLFTVKDQIA